MSIVENSAPEGGIPGSLRLSDTPIVEIGALEGAPEYQLHRVRHVTRLSDDRIVVADEGSGQIRFYDPDGRFIGSSGRQGDGPGEFQQLSFVRRLAGDSVLVFDGRSRRITIIGPDGSYVRDFTPTAAGESAPLNVVGALEDGTLLVREPLRFDPGPGSTFRRDTATFSVARQDGKRIQLEPLAGSESQLNIQTSGGNMTAVEIMRIPYARSASVASAPTHFYLGSNETFEVRRVDEGGRLDAIIRSDHVAPRPVTPELVRRYVDRMIAQRERSTGIRSDAADDAAMQERFADLPLVPTLPFYGTMMADQTGRLWLQEFEVPGPDESEGASVSTADGTTSRSAAATSPGSSGGASEPSPDRWTVFEVDGRMHGTLELPGDFRPHFIDSEVVIGVALDEFDVEYVQVYRLEQG